MGTEAFSRLNPFSMGLGPVIVIGLAISYFVYRIAYNTIFSPLKKVPGPFLGKISSLSIRIAGLRGRRAQKLLELHSRYGPVVRIGPNEVSVGSPKYYRAIYGSPKKSSKLVEFYGGASFVGKDNLFQMTHKSQHAARRKLSAAPYSMQAMGVMEPLIREKADKLVRRLRDEAACSPSGTANALTLCGLYSLEIVCKAGFAKDFFEGTGDDPLALMNAMDGSALTLIFNSLIPGLQRSGLGSKMPGMIGAAYRCHEYWIAKSREMVKDFMTYSKETESYLLTPYLKDVDSFLGRRLDDEEFVEEAMGIMFAGSGTTSTTLTYLLYAISKPEHRYIQERLREEVLSSTDDMVVLRKHPYLNAVIKETFRLYPTIISTLPRVLDENLQIESHNFPPGTIVGMQNFVHHRDPSIFPRPEEFRPDRWLHSTEDMELALTPFSVGKRGCVGQNLAWEELYIAVTSIVKALKLALGSEMQEEDMEMEDRFNIAPKARKLILKISELQIKSNSDNTFS